MSVRLARAAISREGAILKLLAWGIRAQRIGATERPTPIPVREPDWTRIEAALREPKRKRRRSASDERWERIYKEKFEDPEYYAQGLCVRMRSPLATF